MSIQQKKQLIAQQQEELRQKAMEEMENKK